MSDKDTLQGLARKAYLSYHQDGIIDILVGLGITGFGLFMLTTNYVFMMLTWLPILFYMPLKNRITIPRFGFVRFSGEAEQRRKLFIVALIGVMSLSLFAGIGVFFLFESGSPGLRGFLGQYLILVLGIFFALAAIFAAIFTGVWRFVVYAVVGLGIIIAGIQLQIPEPYYVIFIGILILLSGIWLLARFLRKYPHSHEDWGNAAG